MQLLGGLGIREVGDGKGEAAGGRVAMRTVLLHCLVRPVFVTLDDDGRPVETSTLTEPLAVTYNDLDKIKSTVEAMERERNKET
jgi:hypothetical protein